MKVLLCERVNDLRHSLFHLLNCLITTASELREYASHWEQGLDYREGEELSWCPSRSNSMWQGWCCFQTIFVQAFKIVVDSRKFSMLLLYILWDDWPILMISDSNGLLQLQLEYTLLNPDCHSWWISKMQSERYEIKFCFKLGKNATEMYGMLQTAVGASCKIEHQFLSGIRDSRTAGSLWGMMRGVGGVRKSIHHSWLAKGLRLLCWGFKGVQQEIPSEQASTLQIGSVAFPAGQYTSPQLHPCHRLFDQDGHQDSCSASL